MWVERHGRRSPMQSDDIAGRILADVFGPRLVEDDYWCYQTFRDEFMAPRLAEPDWSLTENDVRDWRASDRLTAADKAILAATDESLAGKTISDATWAEVTRFITDPAQQVEFVVAMGNWTMFSMLLRNLHIPVEDGVAVWPPDGKASPAAEE